MTLTVRQGLPEDIDRLVELQSLAIKTLCSTHYSNEQIDIIVTTQAQMRDLCLEQIYVAELEDQVVGFATWVSRDWHFWSKVGQIGGVYVHPDFIRQGIASRLLKHMEQMAMVNNYEQIMVTSSLNAVEFYQAQGYEKRGSTDLLLAWGTRIPCIELRKAYTQPALVPTIPVYLQWLLAVLFVAIVL